MIAGTLSHDVRLFNPSRENSPIVNYKSKYKKHPETILKRTYPKI